MESHEPDLREEVHDELTVRQIQTDYRQADLDSATLRLLDFATKLTAYPTAMTAADVDALRSAGFADPDVVDAVQLIAYFNYINRVLDGLGAGPEPGMRFVAK